MRVRVRKSMAAAADDAAAGFDSLSFCDIFKWFMWYDSVRGPEDGNAPTDAFLMTKKMKMLIVWWSNETIRLLHHEHHCI